MKYFSLLFVCLVGTLINAQVIRGKVVSFGNKQAIPYVRVGIEDENIGTITDKNGNFQLDFTGISRDKYVKVEVGGYVLYRNSVANFIQREYNEIVLQPKVTDIEEVIINPKKYIQRNWGNNSKSKSIAVGHNSELSEAQRSKEIAILFRNRKKAKIEKLNMNIAYFNAKNPVFFRVNVYDKDFNSIITEDISTEITKEDIVDDTFSLDLKPYHIWVKDDFYVSLQVLNDIEGRIYFSGALFGNKALYREYLGKWKKVPIASPAINIDVRVEK